MGREMASLSAAWDIVSVRVMRGGEGVDLVNDIPSSPDHAIASMLRRHP
jgi:hypothetical protein